MPAALQLYKIITCKQDNAVTLKFNTIPAPVTRGNTCKIRQHHVIILASKKLYYSNLVSSYSDNPRHLWQTVNKLLHRKSSSPLPSFTSASSLADSFASFYTNNITKLRLSLTTNAATASSHTPSPSHPPPDFSTFRPATESEIS